MENRKPKLKGMIHADDSLHGAAAVHDGTPATVVTTSGSNVQHVPQYAPTVYGEDITYAPKTNCDGNFMSANYMPNNNCYNYSTNVATNSFAQPGRMTGKEYASPPTKHGVVTGATHDGLIELPTLTAASTVKEVKNALNDLNLSATDGHIVALLISPTTPKLQALGWPGDYHWVRCDTSIADIIACKPILWSQKDGGDQVTNFDFGGNPLTGWAAPVNKSISGGKANWQVNQGPFWRQIIGKVNDDPTERLIRVREDLHVDYLFVTYMYVPKTTNAIGITII